MSADGDGEISAVFRTTEAEYRVPAASLMIPMDSTPARLGALVNFLLDRADDPVQFAFFVNGTLVGGGLRDILQAQKHSMEMQVVIEYTLAKALPEERRQDREPDWIRSVKASDQGICLTGSFDSVVRLYDMNAEACGPKALFAGHFSAVTSLAFLDNKRQFVSGSNDRTLRIWDVEEGSCKAVLRGHSGTVQSVAVGDGLIVSGDYEGKLGFWWSDLSLAKEAVAPSKKSKKAKGLPQPVIGPVIEAKAFVDGHADGPVTSVVFSGAHLLSAGYGPLVRAWDCDSRKVVHSWRTGSATSCMANGPNAVLLGHPDGSLRLLDPRSGQLSGKSELHTGWINGLAMSPTSGHLFVSTAADLRVCIWDLRGLQSGPLRELSAGPKKMLAVDWSPSGRIHYGGEDCILHTCT
jgi:WD40 repeat protein